MVLGSYGFTSFCMTIPQHLNSIRRVLLKINISIERSVAKGSPQSIHC